MKQSKAESFVEACLNTASGFVVSLIVWRWIVAPAFNLPIGWDMNLAITGVFTVVSVARSYLWRRFFNASVHRLVMGWFR